MQSAKNVTPSTYRHAALGGAAVCALLALVYTFAFIVYALVRSALTVVATVNQDAGMMGTLLATWASLVVAALAIGILLSMAVAILGVFTGILVKGVSEILNKHNSPQRASVIGMSVCLAVIVLLHLILRSAMSFS